MRFVGILALALLGCTAEVPGTAGPQPAPAPMGTGGDGSGSGGGSGQTSVTLSQYFVQIAAIQCDQAWQCKDSFPADAGYTFDSAWADSAATCAANLVTAWNAAQVETEIAKGRIEYNGTAAVSCLEGVTFAACSDYWQTGIQWAEPCYHVVTGMVEPGGACESLYSCTTYNCDATTHTCI